MRLFIAIQLNDVMKDALQALQKEMQACGVSGNFTKRENLHLTLAFIGEYDDPDQVLELIRQIEFKPFELHLSGAGAFHQLWWAGIEGDDALSEYAQRLRFALDDAGIPFDRKKFSPHITLVRKPVIKGGMTEDDILTAMNVDRHIKMTVDHISLMRSDRDERGVTYTELRMEG